MLSRGNLSAPCSHHALLVVFDIDNSMFELPGRNPAIEQDITLTVRAVLEFGQKQERHDPADKSGAAPDITALACEIPSGRVEHLRGEIDHGNLGDVIGSAPDTGTQRTQAN